MTTYFLELGTLFPLKFLHFRKYTSIFHRSLEFQYYGGASSVNCGRTIWRILPTLHLLQTNGSLPVIIL